MKKTRSLLTFSIYLITIAIICSIIFIYYFAKKVGPGLIECAKDEVNQLTNLVMNNCIKKYIEENEPLNLLTIDKNNKQEIERIKYNTKMLNQTRAKIIEMLETDLDYMVKGKLESTNLNLNKLSDEYYKKTNEGIIFMVSIGSSTGNPFFANIGPKIPLNLQVIGNTTADITTNITEYGLNNALIEVSIILTTTIKIHMPFLSEEVTTTSTIPLIMEIIQGTIPNYYLTNNIKE